MRTALVCIAKNEDHYIDEWIKYYLKLGFDDIFIYANDWEYKNDTDCVHVVKMDGKNMQRAAYNDCYSKIRGDYNWVAFFDVDEFLVLKKHKNIKEFLRGYSKYMSVGINWYYFGDSNLTHVTDGEYSVLKRFTKRQWIMDKHIKSIVNTKYIGFIDVHCPQTSMVDPNFNEFIGPFNPNGSDDIAQINHYFCKTIEEYQNKISRGRADHPTIIRTNEEFPFHNFNDVDDFSAMNFLYKN